MDRPRTPRRNRKLYLTLVGAVLLAVATTTVGFRVDAGMPAVPRQSVRIAKVEHGTLDRSVGSPGTLVPERIRWITAATTGRVERLDTEPGAVLDAQAIIKAQQDRATIRTLVEPGLMGLPVEAQLWVQTTPQLIDRLGRALAAAPQVRYAAALAGDYQLLVDVTLPSQDDLYRFISAPWWGESITRVRTAMVVGARKRGGRLFDLAA